jgi:hypothetical protein
LAQVQRLALGRRPAVAPLPVLPVFAAAPPPSTLSAAAPASARAGGSQAPNTVSAVNRALPTMRAVAGGASQGMPAVQRSPAWGKAAKTVSKQVNKQVNKLMGGGSRSGGSMVSGAALLGGGLGMLLGGASLLGGGHQNSYQDLRNKAEAVVPPQSQLRSDQTTWSQLIALLDAISRMKSEELNAAIIGMQLHTSESGADLLEAARLDEELYANIVRRLRADMRIDRERFGRLRDGMR